MLNPEGHSMHLEIFPATEPSDRCMVLMNHPHGDGQALVELLAREERPGGFEWLQVSMTLWYRQVLAAEPYTESIQPGSVTTWVPIDAVTFLDSCDYSQVKQLRAGEGRPPGAPRYPMPWDEPAP
ncbi:hypothetical protein OG455_07965 [Kitasatospora sp. NBC_01287]|uniref:hypothetical protein n=1 Tax=Kitasatospora sp. NBC_01287 TaxID=2903573 RepID=UPI00225B7F75|nr:hypothetical protein [Kitasatospora sp. NBC_01287]MCX4745457.1 hypothetical protein [Kitasatospora sp. NBC_01287]